MRNIATESGIFRLGDLGRQEARSPEVRISELDTSVHYREHQKEDSVKGTMKHHLLIISLLQSIFILS